MLPQNGVVGAVWRNLRKHSSIFFKLFLKEQKEKGMTKGGDGPKILQNFCRPCIIEGRSGFG